MMSQREKTNLKVILYSKTGLKDFWCTQINQSLIYILYTKNLITIWFTFTEVLKTPRYLLIYYKISFVKSLKVLMFKFCFRFGLAPLLRNVDPLW